jgi:hypothetical protein
VKEPEPDVGGVAAFHQRDLRGEEGGEWRPKSSSSPFEIWRVVDSLALPGGKRSRSAALTGLRPPGAPLWGEVAPAPKGRLQELIASSRTILRRAAKRRSRAARPSALASCATSTSASPSRWSRAYPFTIDPSPSLFSRARRRLEVHYGSPETTGSTLRANFLRARNVRMPMNRVRPRTPRPSRPLTLYCKVFF